MSLHNYGRSPTDTISSDRLGLDKVHKLLDNTFTTKFCSVFHRLARIGSIGYLFRLPFLLYCITLRYLYVRRLINIIIMIIIPMTA